MDIIKHKRNVYQDSKIDICVVIASSFINKYIYLNWK